MEALGLFVHGNPLKPRHDMTFILKLNEATPSLIEQVHINYVLEKMAGNQ